MKTILALFFLMTLFGCGQGPSPKGKVLGYEYFYTGTMVHPIETFELAVDEKGQAYIDHSANDGVVTRTEVSAEVLEKVDSLFREYKLWKLKDSYYPPFTVYDGYMWHCYFRIDGAENIYSHGSNARPPENLCKGIDAINALLREYLPEPVSDPHTL